MPIQQIIRGLYPGEDKILLFDVEEDATGWGVEMLVYGAAGTTLVTKSTPSDITVVDAESGTHHGLRVRFYAADTVDLVAGSYSFEVRRTDADNETELAVGQLILGSRRGTYSSPAAVIARTGIGPKDLGFADAASLEAFLLEILVEISDLMNQRMRTDYLSTGPVPAGVNGIAADIAAESVRQMVQTRDTPVVRVDDFAIRMVTSRVFTPDINERLKLYGRTAITVDVAPGDILGEPFLGDELIEILEGS